MARVLAKWMALNWRAGPVTTCELSSDGRYLAVGTEDKAFAIVSIDPESLLYSISCDDMVSSCKWIPGSNRVVGLTMAGSVIQITDASSYQVLRKSSKALVSCSASTKGHVAVAKKSGVDIFDITDDFAQIKQVKGLGSEPTQVAWSRDGTLLAIGCLLGYVHVYSTKAQFKKVASFKPHSNDILSLAFSYYGQFLLITSRDSKATLWDVPALDIAWPTSPRLVLAGHTSRVTCGIFCGDETYVITGSLDSELRVWSILDGNQIARVQTSDKVISISHHAPTGTVAVGLQSGLIELWQAQPYDRSALSLGATSARTPQPAYGLSFPLPPATERRDRPGPRPPTPPRSSSPLISNADREVPALARSQTLGAIKLPPTVPPKKQQSTTVSAMSGCVRRRLEDAQSELESVETSLRTVGHVYVKQNARERELLATIAQLETQLARERAELSQLQSDQYRKMSVDIARWEVRKGELQAVVEQCKMIIDSLTDCLTVSGLSDLRADSFSEWLCDIGLERLKAPLREFDGTVLTMLTAENIVEHGVTLNDASRLLLHGFMAHFGYSSLPFFEPPANTVLSWDEQQVAMWISSLDKQFHSLVFAQWNGAALCSLSPVRVQEASFGSLTAVAAAKFIMMIKNHRMEHDGDKDPWIVRWTGKVPIESQDQ